MRRSKYTLLLSYYISHFSSSLVREMKNNNYLFFEWPDPSGVKKAGAGMSERTSGICLTFDHRRVVSIFLVKFSLRRNLIKVSAPANILQPRRVFMRLDHSVRSARPWVRIRLANNPYIFGFNAVLLLEAL